MFAGSGSRVSRFLVVGVVVVLVDGLVYGALLWAGGTTLVAKAVSFGCALVVSYLGNWRYTFNTKRVSWQEARYGAVYAVTLVVNVMGNEGLLWLLRDQWWSLAVAFTVITGVVAGINFVLMSRVVFRDTGASREDATPPSTNVE